MLEKETLTPANKLFYPTFKRDLPKYFKDAFRHGRMSQLPEKSTLTLLSLISTETFMSEKQLQHSFGLVLTTN